jgi:hypothetical protein
MANAVFSSLVTTFHVKSTLLFVYSSCLKCATPTSSCPTTPPTSTSYRSSTSTSTRPSLRKTSLLLRSLLKPCITMLSLVGSIYVHTYRVLTHKRTGYVPSPTLTEYAPANNPIAPHMCVTQPDSPLDFDAITEEHLIDSIAPWSFPTPIGLDPYRASTLSDPVLA